MIAMALTPASAMGIGFAAGVLAGIALTCGFAYCSLGAIARDDDEARRREREWRAKG
jgi:hypothetical protein